MGCHDLQRRSRYALRCLLAFDKLCRHLGIIVSGRPNAEHARELKIYVEIG